MKNSITRIHIIASGDDYSLSKPALHRLLTNCVARGFIAEDNGQWSMTGAVMTSDNKNKN